MSENIAELSIDQINSRITEIVSEFSSLNLSVESSDEDIAKGEALAAEVRSLREELNSRQARADQVAALDATFATDEEPEEAPAVEAAVEETAEADAEEADDAGDEPAAEADEDQVEEVAPVAAAATKTSPAKRAAAHAPEVKMPKSSSVARCGSLSEGFLLVTSEHSGNAIGG